MFMFFHTFLDILVYFIFPLLPPHMFTLKKLFLTHIYTFPHVFTICHKCSHTFNYSHLSHIFYFFTHLISPYFHNFLHFFRLFLKFQFSTIFYISRFLHTSSLFSTFFNFPHIFIIFNTFRKF